MTSYRYTIGSGITKFEMTRITKPFNSEDNNQLINHIKGLPTNYREETANIEEICKAILRKEGLPDDPIEIMDNPGLTPGKPHEDRSRYASQILN